MSSVIQKNIYSHGFAVFLSQASVFNKILSKIFIEIEYNQFFYS